MLAKESTSVCLDFSTIPPCPSKTKQNTHAPDLASPEEPHLAWNQAVGSSSLTAWHITLPGHCMMESHRVSVLGMFDLTLISSTEESDERMLDHLMRTAARVGLQSSASKTKVMTVLKDKSALFTCTTSSGQITVLPRCTEFVYVPRWFCTQYTRMTSYDVGLLCRTP